MSKRQPSENVVRKVARKATEAASNATHRLRQLRHLGKLPELSPLGARIVKEVENEGVSVWPLDELAFDSNPGFRAAMDKALDDPNAFCRESIEYESGFEHCTPINPTRIARHYPNLFLWGLDEGLLDVVENCLGLPAAYHGVIVRKELVDDTIVATRLWHKDGEDRKVMRISVYLTDVLDAKSGPFEYVPRKRSPSYKDFEGVPRITDEHMNKVVPASEWRTCTGPAGTVMFSAVSHVFHHGKLPETERVVASYYYTSRNPTNEWLSMRNSFQRGIPLIDAPLSSRQRDCLWKYQECLPETAR